MQILAWVLGIICVAAMALNLMGWRVPHRSHTEQTGANFDPDDAKAFLSRLPSLLGSAMSDADIAEMRHSIDRMRHGDSREYTFQVAQRDASAMLSVELRRKGAEVELTFVTEPQLASQIGAEIAAFYDELGQHMDPG